MQKQLLILTGAAVSSGRRSRALRLRSGPAGAGAPAGHQFSHAVPLRARDTRRSRRGRTEGARCADESPESGPGPGAAGSYSPRTSEGRGLLGRALGVPSGQKFPAGDRTYQLVVLITAREIDQQYEWSAHEPAGLRAGLEQSVIDIVKYDRPVDGLAEKDATLIRFFRALLREHKVTSDLFAKMIAAYGKQRTVEMMELAGDYWTVGTMMNAGDQHLPATRLPLMPPLARDGRRVD